ncbi:hypothetical protein CE91St62_30120 [Lachnospiraceae bacterium]|uniref:hypothetical protein n=1 Tax=Extibacter sp. GGCC_0201 TaxID=2731209 RepID=UPI001AA1AB3B|nr:hypothetical protein [Extibacter sp. GGCC_0201]MBO1721400.1 hypothetical protein [Extibacter sp. GGCC_0201]BDF34949.1 hypothetical protein CE91St61_30240 [Lachnospiraceae bacterium]BDF38951.1 hypothetical protein CE91St62_30120 [Lachnospiraceae bacterium]
MRPGTATITQIPKLVECSPIAALIPQAKESGEDSPSLPLTPSHLLPTAPAAIYFTGTGGADCVTLPADGSALDESNRNEEEPKNPFRSLYPAGCKPLSARILQG